MLVRRTFLTLTGAALALPAALQSAVAEGASPAPKLTQVLRADLEGQGQKVEETVVKS
jgi:hypothetical protein